MRGRNNWSCGEMVAHCCIPKNTREFKFARGTAAVDRNGYSEQFDLCDFTCNNQESKPGNFPYFTIIISLIQIIIFAIYYSQPGSEINEFNRATLCSPFLYSPYHREEVWRYFTYQFNHAGIVHLAGNLFFQIVIGSLLEIVHGSWRVMLIYFTGVLGGSLCASVFTPEKMLVGASGGDYALVFAFLANLVLNWDSMVSDKPWKWVRLVFLILFIGADVASGIYRHVKSHGTNTSMGAHLGGAITGLTVGLFVLTNFNVKPWERICKYVGLGLFIAAAIFAIFWNAFAPVYKTFDDATPPYEYFGDCQ